MNTNNTGIGGDKNTTKTPRTDSQPRSRTFTFTGFQLSHSQLHKLQFHSHCTVTLALNNTYTATCLQFMFTVQSLIHALIIGHATDMGAS